MWDFAAVNYPKMQYVCVALEKIKDIQMQLEASDQPNFIFIRKKLQIDTAPERRLGATSSQHAKPSTLFGSDTQPSTAGPSLPPGQGRQFADVVMTASMVGDVPAMGEAMQS